MSKIDYNKLKKNFLDAVQRLQKDPAAGKAHPTVVIRLVENVESDIHVKDVSNSYTFKCDEDVVRGGVSKAPSPMAYFLAGLGACQALWYAKCASMMGVEIDSLEISATSHFDIRGEHHIDNVYAGVQKFSLETRIASHESNERIRILARLADSSCPLYSAASKGAPIEQKIVLNGKTISDNTQLDNSRVKERWWSI